MRFLRRTPWFIILLTSSLSEAELYYPAGAVLQIGFRPSEIRVLYPEAVVDAHTGEASWRGADAIGERCTSLMGPSCFYTAHSAAPVNPESSTARMQESSGLSVGDHALQENSEDALQCDVGIMAQYLQASQSQLAAVHGHSEVPKHSQRVGAAREGKLDDVVHVKVGRGGSVRSVYDSSQSLETLNSKQAPSLVVSEGRTESTNSATGATASEMCQSQPDVHKGEQQAEMRAEQSVSEWGRNSDKAAEAQPASVCAGEHTEDEQSRAI